MSEQQNPADAVAIIKALRAQSNAGLIKHDIAPVVAILHDDAKILRSDGSLVIGAAAMGRGFESNFADPAFVSYVRTPDTIDVDGATAAEAGSWIGQWTNRSVRGTYLARWTLMPLGWRIVSELFIPLGHTSD
ncbi:DUF4440 domain-containing protein [soil metagenome]